MPNLDEIKARRGKINGASWKAVEGNSNDIRSSVFAGNDLLATLSSWKRHEYADFIANTPTDIDWLIAEAERLRKTPVCPYCGEDMCIDSSRGLHGEFWHWQCKCTDCELKMEYFNDHA